MDKIEIIGWMVVGLMISIITNSVLTWLAGGMHLAAEVMIAWGIGAITTILIVWWDERSE